MRRITTAISGHKATHHAEGRLFWIFAGIIIVIALGDALTVVAGAIAILTMISWIYREVEHRRESRAEMARVAHIRPELTGAGPEKDFGARIMAWPSRRLTRSSRHHEHVKLRTTTFRPDDAVVAETATSSPGLAFAQTARKYEFHDQTPQQDERSRRLSVPRSPIRVGE
jgi:hypothetical protein